jgi:eukaryotic-like serine/threonine-protein kinase
MSNSRTLHPEDQIAQYRVVGPLGAGGMGEVYLAQDQSLERSVALKVLPYDLTRSDDRVRRFVQEAKSASSLNHPNIVTIYEIGQEPVKSATGGGDSGPLHYISMELISGKTLGAKIHEEKSDLKTLVGYLAQAAEGIAKAHAVGIVHRDLKPGNIMVSDDGYAKVLDFGLAKLTEKTSGPNEATEIADRTTDGAVMGTVSYMSPEQVQGKPVDARADIFSFGCIIYEAATRQRPFTADSNVEIMHKILNEKPRPVEEINPHVPAELRRVIRRCLAKQPEQRAQSMKDIAIELREIVEEYDSLSSSATSATLTGTGVSPISRRRRKSNVAMIAGVTAVVAAAVAFGWYGLMHGKKGESDQPFQTMRFTTQTNRGDVTDCAISPDGRYIAYVAGRGNRNTLRVRQVATGSDVEILPVQDAVIEFPSFTPDGNYIYFCKRKADAPNYRVLMSVPSLGGSEQERGFDVDTRLAFSPDGKRACFVRNYPQKGYSVLVMRDLGTGQDKEFVKFPQPGGPGGAPSWSSDGKFIALALLYPPPKSSTTVALINPETGERRDFFTRPSAFLGDVAWLPDNSGIVLAGFDIGTSLNNQVFLVSYPGAKLRRVSNDFNAYNGVSTGGSDDAIASTRGSVLANLYAIDAATAQASMITATGSPENSPFNLVTIGDRVYYSKLHGDFLGVSSMSTAGGPETTYDTGEGHCVSLKAGANVLLVQRLDANQQMHIWRLDPTGGMKQLISGGGEALLDVSPDGKWFTYGITDSTRGMWIMSTDGGEGRMLSATALKALGGFSHDSKHIITMEFSSDAHGLIQNEFKVLAIDGTVQPYSLKFPQRATDQENPAGTTEVTFIDGSDPNRNLFELEMATGKIVQFTHLTDGAITDHEWSPDGQRLAVTRRLADGENVWFLNRDGSQARQVTHFTGLDVIQIIWTPDGAKVLVDAGQASNDVVLVRNSK